VRVDDVDQTYRKDDITFFLEPTTDEDWGLRMAGVRDPSGNVLYFIEHQNE
jgi:hypothetical protein